MELDLDNAHCPVEKYLSSVELFRHVEHKCDWVFLGDSITNAGRWSELFPSKVVSNQGIDGDTVKGMFCRLDSVSKMKPEYVFILAGINDIIQLRTTDSIMMNYRTLARKLLRNGHNIIIQSTLLTSNADWNRAVVELNIELKRMSDEFGLTYIDLNQGLGFTEAIDPNATFDGTHLLPAAYIKWQQTINESFR